MKLTVKQSKLNGRSIISRYFDNLQKIYPNIKRPTTSSSWAAYMGRVNSFQALQKIEWVEYLKFVDFVFDYLHERRNFDVTSFGIITSTKSFFMFTKYKTGEVPSDKLLSNFDSLLQQWENLFDSLGL